MQGDTETANGPGPGRHAVFRYGLAVVCVVAGVLLSLLLRPVLDATVLLLAAVLSAAWFSGLWPALLASILATLALDYYSSLRYRLSFRGGLASASSACRNDCAFFTEPFASTPLHRAGRESRRGSPRRALRVPPAGERTAWHRP